MNRISRLSPVGFASLLAGLVFAVGCPTQPPVVCGGLQGLACEDGDFCNFPEEAQCGAADQTGTCEAVPEVCTEQYEPVCGCDDKTYGNACLASAAGISVASQGECAPAAVSCDRREVRCRRAEPVCPEGQVVEIINNCFGGCVPIDSCACNEAADCPDEAQYTCHLYRNRCGPYVR